MWMVEEEFKLLDSFKHKKKKNRGGYVKCVTRKSY